MADLLNSGALPIGFLMFFGMAFAFVKRRATHKLASKAFPELAERLGLIYKPSPYRGGIGTLSGTFQGYRVFVDPDEQRKVSLHFEGAPGVLLRNYAQNQRPPAELNRLYSGDRSFDAFFKTRYADDGVAARIQEYEKWPALVAVLEGEFRRELAQFNVSESGITLVVNFGNPPHIPGGAVERLLEICVRCASIIDPVGAAQRSDASPAP
ncbi:MAG TPA: hypothetical protein VI197_35425 [Polyangiaceae bacterium]